MKKPFLTSVLLLGFIIAFGQTADSTYTVSTDFKHIVFNVVSDSNSDYYYPKLEEKVKNSMSELTATECYYLYYGRLFKNKHKGLPFLASLGVPLLDNNPVDLTVLLHTCKCMNDRKDERWEAYNSLFTKLLDAIFSEGTGQSPETAIKVVDIEDERIIKGVLGFIGGTEGLYTNENLHGRVFNVWSLGEQKLYFEELFFEDIESLKLN